MYRLWKREERRSRKGWEQDSNQWRQHRASTPAKILSDQTIWPVQKLSDSWRTLKENCTPKSQALIWKIFFRRIHWWRSEVEFEREDGQTDGQKWPKNLGWRHRAAGMSHWCQASAVRGCVPILINPEFDAALDRDSLNELTWVSFVVHWHLTIFFFFFFFFVFSWVMFDKAVTEYRVWHKVHGTAEGVRCYPRIPGW